jgi:hypothetical protein
MMGFSSSSMQSSSIGSFPALLLGHHRAGGGGWDQRNRLVLVTQVGWAGALHCAGWCRGWVSMGMGAELVVYLGSAPVSF